jgi:hypothetical protein
MATREQNGNAAKVWVGPIPSDVCGRTDHLPVNVPAGAYVLTADTVSATGEGNTIAGFKTLNKFFGRQTYDGGPTREVVVAGGEYVVAPKTIEHFIGGGSLEAGQKALDSFMVLYRKKTIETLKKLPGPKKD